MDRALTSVAQKSSLCSAAQVIPRVLLYERNLLFMRNVTL